MILNKKAQGKIGPALVWIIGFLIIVFTMFLLGIGTLILTGSKVITNDWDKIELDKYEVDKLRMQESLVGLLNGKVDFEGEEISVKDLIIRFDSEDSKKDVIREVIKQEVDKRFVRLDDCYLLIINAEVISQIGTDKIRGRGIKFPIILDDKEIKLEFYQGACLR